MVQTRHMTRRGALGVLASTLSLGAIGVPCGATAADSRGAAAMIAKAAEVRTLGQRMLRCLLYAALEVDTKKHYELAGVAEYQFSRAMGDLAPALAALSPKPELIGAADSLGALWDQIGAGWAGIITRESVTDADIAAFAEADAPLLLTTETLSSKAVGVLGGGELPLLTANAINISARQVMLIQKMAKSVAFLTLGQNVEANQAALEADMAHFETVLTALFDGAPEVMLPPAPAAARDSLATVSALWTDFRPIITRVVDMGIASGFDLTAVSAQAEPLAAAMNTAAGLYLRL